MTPSPPGSGQPCGVLNEEILVSFLNMQTRRPPHSAASLPDASTESYVVSVKGHFGSAHTACLIRLGFCLLSSWTALGIIVQLLIRGTFPLSSTVWIVSNLLRNYGRRYVRGRTDARILRQLTPVQAFIPPFPCCPNGRRSQTPVIHQRLAAGVSQCFASSSSFLLWRP